MPRVLPCPAPTRCSMMGRCFIHAAAPPPSPLTPFREDRERHNGTEANNGLLHCNGTQIAMEAM